MLRLVAEFRRKMSLVWDRWLSGAITGIQLRRRADREIRNCRFALNAPSARQHNARFNRPGEMFFELSFTDREWIMLGSWDLFRKQMLFFEELLK